MQPELQALRLPNKSVVHHVKMGTEGPEVGVVSLIVNNVDVSNGRRVNQCILLTSCRYIHVYMIPPKHCRLIKKRRPVQSTGAVSRVPNRISVAGVQGKVIYLP
uniref:Uncharacterized protein n=1 Tax=Rhipicephalus microplus TaxID=6941 RepID=A0A6G5AFM4_RHIMP